MRRNRRIIIVSILLIILAFWLINRNRSGGGRQAERDFQVKDTAAVTKIFLADRTGNAVTLERQPDQSWMVNKKYPARQEGIEFLFDCFARIRVQSRVSKNTYNTVVQELSTTGIKCEVYLNKDEKPVKVYYIGGSTQDNLGTYMMLENSSVPYVMEVPGFTGYLTPRYSTIEKDWRSTRILSVMPQQIKSIMVEYAEHPEQTFAIERAGDHFEVFSPVTQRRITNPDTIKLNMYLSYFKGLAFEAWDRQLTPTQVDSLRHVDPVIVVSVEETDGKKTIMPMFLRRINAPSMNPDSALVKEQYDVDRLYSFINNGQELVTVQYFVFGKIFATFSDFDPNVRRNKQSTSNR